MKCLVIEIMNPGYGDCKVHIFESDGVKRYVVTRMDFSDECKDICELSTTDLSKVLEKVEQLTGVVIAIGKEDKE
jgi:hypothetical protein